MNKQYLSIPVKYDTSEQSLSDDTKIPVSILVMHDKTNLNQSNFEMDAIEAAKESIKNIPILGYIRKVDGSDTEDFAGHEIEVVFKDGDAKVIYLERPLGVVPETNNYEYVEKDGKQFVKVTGYLWKDYLNNGYEVLQANPNKSVSMEIVVDAYEVRKDGIVDIKSYRYTGVTILGDGVLPAMEGANLQVTDEQFSQKFSKEFYERVEKLNNELKQQFASSDNKDEYKITTDNSKKSADTSSEWKINKGEYFKKIKGASNAKSVFKEAYADVSIPDKIEDITEADCKYPHHHIGDDNKMVISESGIKAARQRAGGQGLADDSAVMKHLKKHYNTLGIPWDDKEKESKQGGENDNMDKKEDEKVENKDLSFSATYRQKREALSNALDPIINRDENGNIVSEIDYWLDDFDDKYCMVEKYTFTDHDRQDEYGRFTYSFDEANMVATITGEFEKLIKTALTQEEYDKVMADRADYSTLKTKVADYESKIAGFETQVDDLTKENNKLKESNKELSDYQQKRKTADHTDELNAEFTQFDEELKDNQEYITYKAQVEADVMAYTKEQVNEKLNAIFGAMQFSKVHKKKEDEKVTAPVIEDKSPEFTGSRYGKYERFIKK